MIEWRRTDLYVTANRNFVHFAHSWWSMKVGWHLKIWRVINELKGVLFPINYKILQFDLWCAPNIANKTLIILTDFYKNVIQWSMKVGSEYLKIWRVVNELKGVLFPSIEAGATESRVLHSRPLNDGWRQKFKWRLACSHMYDALPKWPIKPL